MSWITNEYFAQSPVLAFAVVALGIQITAFCGVSLRTLFRSKAAIDACARMPLNDEEAGHE